MSPSPQRNITAQESKMSPSPQRNIITLGSNMTPSPQRNITAQESNMTPPPQRNIITQGSNMTPSPQRNITSYSPCCLTGCVSGAQRWRHGPKCGRHHTQVCGGRNMCMRSEVFWSVKIHTIVVWVVIPWSLAGGYQHFHRSHCHHLQRNYEGGRVLNNVGNHVPD
jgi:hypothetical protein